jgi:predicted MFS family arabinose efflux permease
VACAYSTSVAEFMAARVLVGLAGAGLIVMALSAVTVMFTKAERPKAVGLMSAATFLAFPIGPILGGWLLTNYWWGWVFLLNVPVVALGLAAVVALMPESREAQRPSVDIIGVTASAAGLVAVFAWERRLTRQPGGQPLMDLSLFASPSFTWGVVLAVVPILALLGVLFTMPQYFQGVLGTSAMGSGVRLLPLVAGLIIGAVPAARVVQVIGAKVAVAAGFILLAAGLFLGALTSVGSSSLFVASWMVLAGIGTGIAMATAMPAALVELSEEKSGVGAAVLQAVNKTGGPFGIAVLGSVLSAGYLGRLNLSGLSSTAAAAARQSVFGGVAVAHKIHSTLLLRSVDAAFVHGMDMALLVSAGTAVMGAVLAVVFLPRTNASAEDKMKLGVPKLGELDGPRPATIGAAA